MRKCNLTSLVIIFFIIIVLTFLILLMKNFVSGSEAMFADLCYFSVRSVQVKKQEIQLVDHISYMFP